MIYRAYSIHLIHLGQYQWSAFKMFEANAQGSRFLSHDWSEAMRTSWYQRSIGAWGPYHALDSAYSPERIQRHVHGETYCRPVWEDPSEIFRKLSWKAILVSHIVGAVIVIWEDMCASDEFADPFTPLDLLLPFSYGTYASVCQMTACPCGEYQACIITADCQCNRGRPYRAQFSSGTSAIFTYYWTTSQFSESCWTGTPKCNFL